MSKPTDAASEGLGATATLYSFPTKLTAPVVNVRRPGRYPRGVASLRQARWSRTLEEMKDASDALRDSATECKEPNSLNPVFLAASAGLVAALASKLVADLRALEGSTD